jgi:uncharacterized protein YbjT (DUF2867 family)
VLVTGGTGTLGRPFVELLRGEGAAGRGEGLGTGREAVPDVRVLSRHPGEGRFVGDLKSGAGLEAALRGATSVVHLATSFGGGDAHMTRNLLDAAEHAGVGHIVYLSIVGIDKISLGYYKQKLESERIVAASPVPHTIMRATQVHNLVATLFAAQRYSPVLFAPSIRIQPIAVEEVGARLVELVDAQPAGRVADIGGPQKLTGRELADEWKRYRGSRRAVWPLRLPGGVFRTLAAGSNLVDGKPYGVMTFAEFLAGRVR